MNKNIWKSLFKLEAIFAEAFRVEEVSSLVYKDYVTDTFCATLIAKHHKHGQIKSYGASAEQAVAKLKQDLLATVKRELNPLQKAIKKLSK